MEKEVYNAKLDPTYGNPVIDIREKRKRTVLGLGEIEYTHVHGYFEGTNVKFLYCFPGKDSYMRTNANGEVCGRFYQHLSPFPGPDEELASLGKSGENDMLGFCLSVGAIFVESNMGACAAFGGVSDPTIYYKSSAAVAEYCRIVAREIYGEHRVYGYVTGGSGGGYKTMSCIENTSAFDGALPYVIGSPMSLPNCLTVFAHGMRMLRHSYDKLPGIFEPGGSGDIYSDLTEEESDAIREMISIGVPPRVLTQISGGDYGALPVLLPGIKMLDPTYFTDFWTEEGYLGAVEGGSAQRDRISIHTRVTAVGRFEEVQPDGAGTGGEEVNAEAEIDGRNGTDDAWQKLLADGSSIYIEVEKAPDGDDLYLAGCEILFESGEARGKKLALGTVKENKLVPGMSYGVDNIEEFADRIKPGDEIFIDNSDFIAVQTYHRHQMPVDPTFLAWDQYKKADGSPMYPQRPQLICYGFTAGGCGSVQDGNIQGKVIVMNNLMDGDFPWQADWYGRKIESVIGTGRARDMVRVWYNDNAPHGDVAEVGDYLHYVSYLGMLYQGLLDLADWVERDIKAVPTTGYELTDNQIIPAAGAAERGGLQPIVRLDINGKKAVRIKAGEEVCFETSVDIPPAGGDLKGLEYSFEGEQDYPYAGTAESGGLKACHTYSKPGTYYPVVRVVTNRTDNPYTKLQNLDRACVVVE